MGDGSVFYCKDIRGKEHYGITFYPDDLAMANYFAKCFEEVYGIKLKIFKLKNHYKTYIKNKIIYNDLISIASFGSLEWTVPTRFLKSNDMKREFLKAFFDCEAYVWEKAIQLQSVNKKGLEGIKKILGEFDIASKIYEYERKNKNWNKNYILCIMRKEERDKYLKNIGFNHSLKMKKLNAGDA